MSAVIQPGSLLTPSVRLVRAFGAGGMGSVWLADHLALHTQVVVKFMSGDLAGDAAAVARFAREASAAAQVKSPHVVQMLDHGITPSGLPYIIMELLEGRELSKHLDDRLLLPPEEVAAIVTQMCKALRRAHERGIIHRDIKPDNIFMCDVGGGDLFIKLLDFGIAKSAQASLAGGSGTRTGAMIGTPYYMSPEQLVGAKEIDHRTDLWSLAVVAFQALTGHLPFMGETIAGLAVAIHSATPLPSQHNRSLSPAIDAWFAKACARDPAERYPSATEMAAALELAVQGSARYALAQPNADSSQRTVALPTPPPLPPPPPAPPQSGTSLLQSAPNIPQPVPQVMPSAHYVMQTAPNALHASTQAGFGATLQPATEKRSIMIAALAAFLVAGLVGIGGVWFVFGRTSEARHDPGPIASTSVAASAPVTEPAAQPQPAAPVSPDPVVQPSAPAASAAPSPVATTAVTSSPRVLPPTLSPSASASARSPLPPPSASARPSTPKSAPLPATKDFERQ